jgi:hypothetical protein
MVIIDIQYDTVSEPFLYFRLKRIPELIVQSVLKRNSVQVIG